MREDLICHEKDHNDIMASLLISVLYYRRPSYLSIYINNLNNSPQHSANNKTIQLCNSVCTSVNCI